jgi:hypothetical protein
MEDKKAFLLYTDTEKLKIMKVIGVSISQLELVLQNTM